MSMRLVVLCLAVITLTSCATTPPPEENSLPSDSSAATGEWQTEDLTRVPLPELKQRVATGDTKAQAELGARYGKGDGVEQDYEKAISILREAAAKGEPAAEFYLGTAYYSGLGVERSEAESVVWFERAADKGYAPAQYWLAVLIKEGRGGISPSWDAAVPLLWESAMQGYPDSEFLLGYAYQTGSGVKKNVDAAAFWYRRLLHKMENVRALFNLATLIKTGEVEWRAGDPEALKPPAAEKQ